MLRPVGAILRPSGSIHAREAQITPMAARPPQAQPVQREVTHRPPARKHRVSFITPGRLNSHPSGSIYTQAAQFTPRAAHFTRRHTSNFVHIQAEAAQVTPIIINTLKWVKYNNKHA
eukprot:6245829-Pyramimonas_sp.AAC.2